MWDMMDIGNWLTWLGVIVIFVYIVGLIALIIWGVIRLTRRNEHSYKRSPIEIAKERYAVGEISKAELEHIKRI